METVTETPVAPPSMDQPDAALVQSDSKASDEGNDNAPNSNDKNGNGNQNKKDRKPRRGLPLPDPIPEEPVKPYPAPSKDELQKRLDEENAKMQECFARLSQTRQFLDERQKIRDAARPTLDVARKELGQLNEECRVMFDERKALTARLKELREQGSRGSSNAFAELTGAGKDGTDALKDVNNMEDLENRIRQYQYRLETESMPILEEKKIVSKISFLTHKGRDFIQARDASEKTAKAENDKRKVTRAELEQKRAALDVRIDTTKEKMDEKKKKLDELWAKTNEEQKKLSDSSPEVDRGEERKKITEIRAVMRKLRDDFQDELDKHYLNRRIMSEQLKISKRKKYEAIAAEREEKRKAWEAEQAQYPEPHPYQAEKDMCSGLTVYLKTLLGETIEKPLINLRAQANSVAGLASAPSLKSGAAESSSREIMPGGKAIGKNASGSSNTGFEELAFSDFVKKSKKGRKARKPAGGEKGLEKIASNDSSAAVEADENSSLKPHSIDYLTAFSKLGIKAPNRLSEVRAALDAVVAKAAFYETAPAPSDEEKEAVALANKSNKKTPKKMANGDTDIMNGDANAAFPGLGSGSGSRGGSSRVDMPSFKAVASGDAAAPAPAVAPPSNSVAFPAVGESPADEADQGKDDGAEDTDAGVDEDESKEDADKTDEADNNVDGNEA